MADINLQALVTPLLSSLAGGGLVTFVLQTWFSERLKGAIQAEYAQKLENLKSQLAATVAEHNARFSALNTRRFDAIAAIHAALLTYHEALKRLTAGFRPTGSEDEDVLLTAVADASRDFNKVLTDNRIFLTKVTAAKIAEIRDMLLVNSNKFLYTVSLQQRDPNRGEKWMAIEQTVRGPVNSAIDDLETDLRALMGDKPAA